MQFYLHVFGNHEAERVEHGSCMREEEGHGVRLVRRDELLLLVTVPAHGHPRGR